MLSFGPIAEISAALLVVLTALLKCSTNADGRTIGGLLQLVPGQLLVWVDLPCASEGANGPMPH